jgi:hypothetical protein
MTIWQHIYVVSRFAGLLRPYVLQRIHLVNLRVMGFQGHRILCVSALAEGNFQEVIRIDSFKKGLVGCVFTDNIQLVWQSQIGFTHDAVSRGLYNISRAYDL